MYILGIETTGHIGSVSLYNSLDGNMSYKETDEEMAHLRNLTPMIDEILKENNIKPKELSKIACSVGPGSYTGIRIGVSTARAMAQALGIPCVPISSLGQFKILCNGEDDIAVIYNARRGQVYGSIFGSSGEEILKPGPYMLTEVLDVIKEKKINPVFYGDGIDFYKEKLNGFRLAPVETRYQKANMTVISAMHSDVEVGYNDLLPQYMRETEAEQKLRDGTLAKLRAAKMEKFRNQ